MDINSLLSPQESPRDTPAPPVTTKYPAKKQRKPRASKLANSLQESSSSPHSTPPPTLPHSTALNTQRAVPPTSVPNPVSGMRTSAAVTPPLDGSRLLRQPSTAGMDTLADLASMQHHQQTARANAGGLRSAEIYDTQTSTAATLPAIQSISKPQGLTRLRGRSFDLTMADAPAHAPSPRTYTASSLSEADLHTVTELAGYIAKNVFAYESHVQLINLLHKGLLNHIRQQSSSRNSGDPHTYDLLQDLQTARESMSSRFALSEELWADWIQDQIFLARSIEDRIAIMELCQKAVEEEPTSTKLWLIYAQWMLSLYKNAHVNDERVSGIGDAPRGQGWSDEDRMVAREIFGWQQMMSVWKRGAHETMWRINDSQLLWDPYTELMLQELASSPSPEADSSIQHHFVNRLQIPHATWAQTFQMYSTYVSTYDNAHYETTMVTTSRLGNDAKHKYEMRDFKEISVLRAQQKGDQEAEYQAFIEYIEYELGLSRRKNAFNFDLANALYQRATLRFPARTELWEAYVMFLNEEIASHGRHIISTLPVLEKATRHCPWSGTLWSQYLLAAEISRLPFTVIGDIKHKATSTGVLDAGGMEEVLKVHTAWCGFLRRRAFHQDSTDEEMDVAEVGIRSAIEDMETMGRDKYGKDYQGDPEYRLEKIYIKYLTQCRNWNGARDAFRKLTASKGDHYEFWIRYYIWEMTTWCKLAYGESDPNGGRPVRPTEATKVLQEALKRPNLDWPEKIIETFLYHCEDNEDAQQLQSAVAQVWKLTRAVKVRREREAYEAYQAAQIQASAQQEDVEPDVTGIAGKRKRDDDPATAPSKKSRPEILDTVEPQAQEQSLTAGSTLKRDREHSTVAVRNLPVEITETRLRQYFRDCGTIISLKLWREDDHHSATASIEFESKEDVLTAQTKDMKTLDGNGIEVQIGSGSTLYVCNFPPTADEAWIRGKFLAFGEVIDVRFPSLKYNTHRRFCYVQFKLPSQAHSATRLDGESLGDGLELSVKISDPKRKQERQGPMYEGRELYLANLQREATGHEVKELFSKYGRVESVRIPKKVDGTSRGIGFVVFRDKDDATAALELNLTTFKGRILNVVLSTNDKGKRQATQIVTTNSQRASDSPQAKSSFANGHARSAASPTPPAPSKSSEIQARTMALVNIPDTINDARIRALVEPHGELVKVVLRPDHQGAIIEYKEVASVGKAALALEGYEIAPGRAISVCTVKEMLQQRAEKRFDRILSAPKTVSAALQGPASVRRPVQPGARRGGRGGLGVKGGGVGLSGDRARKDQAGKEAEFQGQDDGKAKSNADFKAMFLAT